MTLYNALLRLCFHFDHEGIAALLYEDLHCIIDFNIPSLLFRE